MDFQDDYIKWYFSTDSLEPKFIKTIEKFIKLLPQCTAIVCCNYMIYKMVVEILQQLGKRIPQDYSVVCLDYSKEDWEEKKITCSIHQGKMIGEEVAKRLLQMIENKEMDENKYSCVLSPLIYEGESIKTIRRK